MEIDGGPQVNTTMEMGGAAGEVDETSAVIQDRADEQLRGMENDLADLGEMTAVDLVNIYDPWMKKQEELLLALLLQQQQEAWPLPKSGKLVEVSTSNGEVCSGGHEGNPASHIYICFYANNKNKEIITALRRYFKEVQKIHKIKVDDGGEQIMIEKNLLKPIPDPIPEYMLMKAHMVKMERQRATLEAVKAAKEAKTEKAAKAAAEAAEREKAEADGKAAAAKAEAEAAEREKEAKAAAEAAEREEKAVAEAAEKKKAAAEAAFEKYQPLLKKNYYTNYLISHLHKKYINGDIIDDKKCKLIIYLMFLYEDNYGKRKSSWATWRKTDLYKILSDYLKHGYEKTFEEYQDILNGIEGFAREYIDPIKSVSQEQPGAEEPAVLSLPSEATGAPENLGNDEQNMGEISEEEKEILNKELKQEKLKQEKEDEKLAQEHQQIYDEYEQNLKGGPLIKPAIEPVKTRLWSPPVGSDNGVNKCWLNAPLYTILQNEYIRDKIIEHGESNKKNVFSETIKNLLKPVSGKPPPWNQEKYSEIINKLKDNEGDINGLIKLDPEANDPLTDVDYGEGRRDEFITDLLNGEKIGDGITKSFYYDARHTLHYLENVLEKIGINIYIINTTPFGDNGEGKYVDCNKYAKTLMADPQEEKIWKGCVPINEGFDAKLIGLVQSYNIYSIDPITKKRVQGEAGHYRSFIPIEPRQGDDFNENDFNANYKWVRKDALYNFIDENVDPESGHFAHSYYLFLEKPNKISFEGGGKRRVRTNKKRKGRRVNRTEKKNKRSRKKGNRRSRNERTPRERVQRRNEKTPKKRTLKKRR